ncbi:serpin family protein [uncultured Ruminococcus sp.]|uniref:serpin family protein n=1 Tax=uncultured Ruminococcus sp. TaxID=165186 RepID=UPI0025D514D4|nr:serpin family protein [uncultured Ruminococcus sp.]
MRKSRKIIAALMAAVMTATSSALTFTNADTVNSDTMEFTTVSDEEADEIRQLISDYIAENNKNAWVLSKDETPSGIVLVGYNVKDEQTAIDISNYANEKGIPQVISFVQYDHDLGEKDTDLDNISWTLSYFISDNRVAARVVPKSALLDGVSEKYVYVEYAPDSADAVNAIKEYSKKCGFDADLIRFGEVGTFSKPLNKVEGYTFYEFSKLTKEETEALFEEKAKIKTDGFRVWTKEVLNNEGGAVKILFELNPYEKKTDDVTSRDAVYRWDDDKLREELALPEEIFDIRQMDIITLNGSQYARIAINPKVDDRDKALELLAAALNFVQLNKYYNSYDIEYSGAGGDKTIGSHHDLISGDVNCDGAVDMADAVLIMQALANPDKYGINGTAENHLTEQGRLNGDFNGDGLTVGDALTIQKKLLGYDITEGQDAAALLGLKDSKVKSAVVTGMIGTKKYSFEGEKAQAVVDYLKSLHLVTNFSENPDEYNGGGWTIDLEYEGGDTVTVWHNANMFIRNPLKPWYRMDYEEAFSFDNLLFELDKQSTECYPAMIMVNGTLYKQSDVSFTGDFSKYTAKKVTSFVKSGTPQKDGETNFDNDCDAEYIELDDGTIALKDGLNCFIFKPMNDPSLGSVRLDDKVSVQAAEGKTVDEKFAAAEMKLGVELLKKGFDPTKKDEENMLISPMSISAALAMTANGADGETLREMENVIGSGLTLDQINEYMAYYMNNLPDNEKEKVYLSDSIWFKDKESFKVYDEFLEKNKKYYNAELYKAPFNNDTVDDINGWVSDNTKGMIPGILDKGALDPTANEEMLMMLINTLYFEADWQVPYEWAPKGEFTDINGNKRTIERLGSKEREYFDLGDADAFKKPYAGGNYSFVGILPKENDIVEYVKNLDAEKLLAGLSECVDPDSIDLYTMIPKFEYDYSKKLNDILEEMGMPAAFSPAHADFSKINDLSVEGADPLYISTVLHKTKIEVTETGTKAAAATAIGMAGGAMYIPKKEVYVYLDRPFVYMIVDKNNVPLFMGVATQLGDLQ